MTLIGKQKAILVLAGLLILGAGTQLDETFSAIGYFWQVNHTPTGYFRVPHWWTSFTITSALFAPFWIVVVGTILLLLRRRSLATALILSPLLIVEPLSCASARPSDGSGGIFGLEERPFATAEREANRRHLERIYARLNGDNSGSFPISEEQLRGALEEIAFELSPYEQSGEPLMFDLRFIETRGMPFTADPEKPGIVYYAVHPDGKQFTLSISGLNAPIALHASMMKEEAFVGSKQPWNGLLVIESAAQN